MSRKCLDTSRTGDPTRTALGIIRRRGGPLHRSGRLDIVADTFPVGDSTSARGVRDRVFRHSMQIGNTRGGRHL